MVAKPKTDLKIGLSDDDHDRRSRYWGASDCAAALGRSPFESRACAVSRKIGLLPPKDIHGDHLDMGHVMEEGVGKYFSLKSGLDVQIEQILVVHPEYPFIGATLDGYVWENGEKGTLQLKTMYENTYNKYWHRHWMDLKGRGKEFSIGKVSMGGPSYQRLQVRHEQIATGLKFSYLVGWVVTPGKAWMCWDRIDYDAGKAKIIVDGLAEAWSYVLDKKVPPALETDAHEAYRKTLGKIKEDQGTTVELGEVGMNLVMDAKNSKEVADEALKDHERAKAYLVEKLGNHSVGVLPNGKRVTWKANVNGVRTLRLPKL